MNRRYALYAAAPLAALGLATAAPAFAHGFGGWFSQQAPEQVAASQNARFSAEAQLLGLTVDDVKAAWAKGQNIRDLAKEKGISEDDLKSRMKQAALERQKTTLQVLVSQGVITQAQADARLQFMQTQQNTKAKGHGSFHFGL